MRTIRRLPFTLLSAVLVVTAALSLAACGDDDETTVEAAGDTEAAVETASDGSSTEEEPEGEPAPAIELSISDAWSRQPADGQTVSAMYGIVSNPGEVDVTIVSASSPVSTQVELHETVTGDDGLMSMVEREDGFVVPAGGTFVFEPGGPHVMFLDIDAASYPDEVEVTFEFDLAEPLTVMAEVRALEGGMDMDHDHGDHGDHSDGATADDEHDHGDHSEMSLDVSALHELDDQLAAGNLDVMAQRMVVGDYIEVISAGEPAADSPDGRLLAILVDLDAALEAGDLPGAAALAAEAHDVAHDLGHGHG
jgi:periplasmic copper chaperone A